MYKAGNAGRVCRVMSATVRKAIAHPSPQKLQGPRVRPSRRGPSPHLSAHIDDVPKIGKHPAKAAV